MINLAYLLAESFSLSEPSSIVLFNILYSTLTQTVLMHTVGIREYKGRLQLKHKHFLHLV